MGVIQHFHSSLIRVGIPVYDLLDAGIVMEWWLFLLYYHLLAIHDVNTLLGRLAVEASAIDSVP